MRFEVLRLCTGLLQRLLHLALRLIITAVESQWSPVTSDNNSPAWLAMATIIGRGFGAQRLIIQATAASQSHLTSDNTSHGWLAKAAIIGPITSDNMSHGEPFTTCIIAISYPSYLAAISRRVSLSYLTRITAIS